MKKPNILLLMCDQFRGDALSYKGHPDVQTPFLDTLATQGVSFDNAYSACPSCIPARAALFTGKSQANHGRVGYEDGVDWNYDRMLPQLLSDGGYQTQCVGKMHVHPARKTCGFQNVKLHDGYLSHYRHANIPYYEHQSVSDDYLYYLKDKLGPLADVSVAGPTCNSWVVHPWIYEEKLHPTNWVVDESIRFLQTREREKPFFLMSSFVRPHQPFDAPATYLDLYKHKTLKKPAHGDWNDVESTNQYGYIKDSIYGCNNEAMKQEAMAGYYACITHVDHQIGRLLSALEEDGTYDDTIILFISDHGELLFDHHLYRKVFAYEGSTHIPCILHVGKNVGDVFPFRSNTLVELRDILPTLLDFAGLAIPKDVDGFSLVPEVFNQTANTREYLHGEHSFHSQLSSHFIVSDHDKYIWYSEKDSEQYFDLAHDPNEEHNAIKDEQYQARIAYLRSCLIKALADREEGYSDGETLIPHRPTLNTLTKTRG